MIPQLLLEQILLGEKKAEDYYEKYGQENIEKALDELKKDNDSILKSYDAEKAEEDFIKKLYYIKNAGLKSEKKTSGFAGKSSFIRFSAAAVFIAAISAPVLLKSGFYENNASSGIERVKGKADEHQIRLYRQNGNEAVLLKNGESAKENDLIQITYFPGKYRYGIIFSVDGNKNVTRHFPEDSWTACELEKKGREVPLSFSYALDDAPDYECFIFAASENEFELSEIEKIDREKLNPEFLKSVSYLPENCDGSIFLLKKGE